MSRRREFHTSFRVQRIGLVALLLALAIAVSSSGSEGDGGIDRSWADPAAAYFSGLADAYTREDFYGVLDHYTPDAYVDGWRIDLFGGPIVTFLRASPIQARTLLDVHLGDSEALSLIAWPLTGRFGAVESEIRDGLIHRETVFHDVTTLVNGARATPDLVDAYVRMFTDYAAAWSDGDASGLYAPGAQVRDGLTDAVVEAPGPSPGRSVRLLSLFELADEEHGPAVYLAASAYGEDPGRAVGVFAVETDAGCELRVAVRFSAAGGLITDEVRYPSRDSFRACGEVPAPSGWWTGLDPPGPRDRLVTHEVDGAGGQSIRVHNGTDTLVGLLEWGIDRFRDAGLEVPSVSSVTFEPSRTCADISGRVVDGEEARDLFLCLYEADLCPAPGPCEAPILSARQGMLHELGHAWLLDHAGSDLEQALVDLAGLPTWGDTSYPWHERGAEYAAEVLAWGLLDEAAPMVRIGSPPCGDLLAAFTLLTGVPGPLAPTEADCWSAPR